jgi:hypothetical protein
MGRDRRGGDRIGMDWRGMERKGILNGIRIIRRCIR